jgi:hypothetical protein
VSLRISDILTLRAGPQAHASIAGNGVNADAFSAMLGASGGPKWLILAGLDRYLAGTFFRERQQPLALLGTSIGTWRHAYLAQRDPLAALDRFLAAYLAQRYSAKPDVAELTREAQRLLNALLGDAGVKEISNNRVFRTHILAARCHGAVASNNRHLLLAGLIAAAVLNAFSRRSLGLSFERAMFAPASGSDFQLGGLPGFTVTLNEHNLVDALLATAAVPMVFAPRRNIPGAPPGTYRDGGITDYHFDLDIEAPPGLVLYPHFYGHITPGWFDKMLAWRKPHGALAARTLLVAPAPAFIASLPARAIPDRRDFLNTSNDTREKNWRAAVAASEQLGEAFARWRDDSEPARWLTPL